MSGLPGTAADQSPPVDSGSSPVNNDQATPAATILSPGHSAPDLNRPPQPDSEGSHQPAEPTSPAVPASTAALPPAASATSNPSSRGPLTRWLGWTASDQSALTLLLVINAGLLLVYWGRMTNWGQAPITLDRLPQRAAPYVIDVNEANWVEWMQLEGVGETLAKRIVDYRDKHGPFRQIDDLRRVTGIGPKTLDKLRPHLRIPSSAATVPP